MPPFESPHYPARSQPGPPFAYGPAEPGLAYACAWSFLKLYNLLFIHEIRARRPAELPGVPKIIASNHPNATDGFVLPFVFPDEKLSVLAQASVFSIPVLGGWLAGAGGIPVVRGRPEAALGAAQQRLGQGYSVYICPEGRLNQGGALGRGHTGAVRLALAGGTPIMPVGFYVPPGNLLTWTRTAGGRAHTGRWQMGGAIYVEIGEAWWPARALDGPPRARDYRRLTDQLMGKIGALTSAAEDRARLQPR